MRCRVEIDAARLGWAGCRGSADRRCVDACPGGGVGHRSVLDRHRGSKTVQVDEATGGADVLAGSLRRARQLFSEELTRLEVTLDERAALDCLLDEMADQFDISRQTLVRGYLGEEAVRELARRAAAEATGSDASLHAASERVAQEHPESADWPLLVRNYLVDHYAVRSGADRLAQVFLGEGAGVEERGLLRFGYCLPHRVAEALSCVADDTVAVVSAQHRSLVSPGLPLVADRGWGRPQFEWAYELVASAYRRRTGIGCDRLVWAWADSAMVTAAHWPHLGAAQARNMLAGIGGPGAVAVVARVPVERCLFSSHIVWDGLLLRGRYIPTDIEDALRFHVAHGSTQMGDDNRESVVGDAIVESWLERFFSTPADRACDFRLQVCVDRVDPEEIVEVIDIERNRAVPARWMMSPDVDPSPLTARGPTTTTR